MELNSFGLFVNSIHVHRSRIAQLTPHFEKLKLSSTSRHLPPAATEREASGLSDLLANQGQGPDLDDCFKKQEEEKDHALREQGTRTLEASAARYPCGWPDDAYRIFPKDALSCISVAAARCSAIKNSPMLTAPSEATWLACARKGSLRSVLPLKPVEGGRHEKDRMRVKSAENYGGMNLDK